MERQRTKSKKLLVRFPDGTFIFHSTSESTYLASISHIIALVGGNRLRRVGLKISHLPVFTRTPYPQFAKYMKPCGSGYYANTIGGTSNKYLQLCAINSALGLGLTVELVNKDPIVRSDDNLQFYREQVPNLDLGKPKPRTSGTLRVTYSGHTYDFDHRSGSTQFAALIEAIGERRISRFGLKCGQKDLLTPLRITDDQYHCGTMWLNVPSSMCNKHKLLIVIKSLLHLDMTVEGAFPSKTSFDISAEMSSDETFLPTVPVSTVPATKTSARRKAPPPNPALYEKTPPKTAAKTTVRPATKEQRQTYKLPPTPRWKPTWLPPPKLKSENTQTKQRNPKPGETLQVGISRVEIIDPTKQRPTTTQLPVRQYKAKKRSVVASRQTATNFDREFLVCTADSFLQLYPQCSITAVGFPFAIGDAPRVGFIMLPRNRYVPAFLRDSHIWKTHVGNDISFSETLLIVDQYWLSEAVFALSDHGFKVSRLSPGSEWCDFPTFSVTKAQ